MGFILFFGFLISIAGLYFTSEKNLSAMEHMGIFLLFMYAYTTVFDLFTNWGLLAHSQQAATFLIYTAGEFVFTICILALADRWHTFSTAGKKAAAFVICIGVLTSFEAVCAFYGFFRYDQWKLWTSLIRWPVWIVLALGMRKMFRTLVKKGEART
ncbi:hypothetical protein [Paenibacillus hamazuiensis]|uniref:hypothetical protein n=1 Tax=Paenibacillus hamazuiensis TaxID=2936508 RepID=UPI00200EA7B8|nr:hypothetical protein [Paenibacillus hamazuiensis]